MQDEAVFGAKRRGVEDATVPEELVRAELAAHAGERRLGREGHANRHPGTVWDGGRPPGRGGVHRGGEGALPDAVERRPCVAGQKRSRVGRWLEVPLARRRHAARRDLLAPRRPERREPHVLRRLGLALKHTPQVQHPRPFRLLPFSHACPVRARRPRAGCLGRAERGAAAAREGERGPIRTRGREGPRPRAHEDFFLDPRAPPARLPPRRGDAAFFSRPGQSMLGQSFQGPRAVVTTTMGAPQSGQASPVASSAPRAGSG